MSQPYTNHPPPGYPAIIPLLAAHHSPPSPFSVDLDRLTVYSSRFMLRTIETVVVSERHAGASTGAGAATGSDMPRPLPLTLWRPASGSSLLSQNQSIRRKKSPSKKNCRIVASAPHPGDQSYS